MDENPYKSPATDFMADLRAARRRRRLISYAMMFGIFVGLFTAYWGIRILLVFVNRWLFR